MPTNRDPETVERWIQREYSRIRREAQRVGADIWFGDEAGVRSDGHAGAARQNPDRLHHGRAFRDEPDVRFESTRRFPQVSSKNPVLLPITDVRCPADAMIVEEAIARPTDVCTLCGVCVGLPCRGHFPEIIERGPRQ
jgi:hypothetical protein